MLGNHGLGGVLPIHYLGSSLGKRGLLDRIGRILAFRMLDRNWLGNHRLRLGLVVGLDHERLHGCGLNFDRLHDSRRAFPHRRDRRRL